MHLLYLDESGSTSDPKTNHFILAGVSVQERKTHWIEQDLNGIAEKLARDAHEIELHGSPMFGGRAAWRKIPKQARLDAIASALTVAFKDGHARVFAAIIKKGCSGLEDPVELAFEELCRRFDLHVAAINRSIQKKDQHQRGIIIFDKCSTENRIQHLARTFKYSGHRRGQTRNYAEVPLFLDSQASRLIQLADLVAYSIFRSYEYGDDSFFDIFRHRIHAQNGQKHGLFELLTPKTADDYPVVTDVETAA